MASLERILVPTDFSAGSYAALGYAVFLARRIGAELEVLHVAEIAEGLDGEMRVMTEGAPAMSYAQLLRSRAEVEMKKFVSDVPGGEGVHIRSRIELGKSAEKTIEIANHDGFDLIVMGTRGRTGIAAAVVGSVAEKVIRGALCPVMTVRVPES